MRTKLTLLTVAVAGPVLLVSTILALYLSTRMLETQAREYADLLAYQVTFYAETLWRSAGRDGLVRALKALTKEREDITAVDVFFFDSADSQIVRGQATQLPARLSQEEQQNLQKGHTLVAQTWRKDQLWISVLSPFHGESNNIIGAVRVWIRAVGIQRLLTTEASTTLLLAVVFAGVIFFALKAFLNNSMSRPLEQLAAAMQKTATGNLSTRIAVTGQDEFGQLGRHFNHMLTRLEEADAENHQLMMQLQQMNNELGERVARATQGLVVCNQELLRLQREMTRVEPLAAGRIMGSIAHELGTPLNSVLGYSQLLAQEDLPQEARESLEVITTQTRRMADIIQHYLGRTRDAARDYQAININTLIENTLDVLKPSFLQHKVEVTMTLAERLPLIRGESAALQRVLINVINNAIDAMEDGGRLRITTRASASPETTRPSLTLEVTDTGNGIPPEILPHIFEPLVTTKAPGKGIGLGLMICQEIVRSHGGALSIRNTVEKGACVQILLPTEDRTLNPT